MIVSHLLLILHKKYSFISLCLKPEMWQKVAKLTLAWEIKGDQADPNCYRPISILPCLSKVLEKLVNNQLTGFLDVCSILSGVQSGFHSGYGCVTATLKVLNDVTIALDSKQCCAAIFIDLAKAFDKVDLSILVGRLRSFGVSEGSLAWFANYFSQRA